MSSYLNIYLVPKKKNDEDIPEPLLFMSYSRNSGVYQACWESIAYIGNGDSYQYTELTSELISSILEKEKENLDKFNRRYTDKITIAKEVSPTKEFLEDLIEDSLATKEYIEELENTIKELENIASWVNNIQYSEFEKVLANVD